MTDADGHEGQAGRTSPGRYADVSLHPSARVMPGVLGYRLDDGLFFANASYVRGRIHEAVQGAPTPAR